MRIYQTAYELMSETGRNLWEMGSIVTPKRYQNKDIEGNDDFITKELMCEQYTLLTLPDPDNLFKFMGQEQKQWADAEFMERVSGKPLNPGEAWRCRKDVWKEFLTEDKIFDYTYPERINMPTSDVDADGHCNTYLGDIINLLSWDPDTRKAVLSVYNPTADARGIGQKYRIPCSMYYDFLIRRDPDNEQVLHMTYHQRSSDFVTFFGSDVYLAWRLKDFVAGILNIRPGYLIHTIDSLHAYKKDWTTLKTCLGQL